MQKNRAFFLDRDNVIIRDIPYLSDSNLVDILPDVSGAIKRINQSGFKCIVVTNQSGIARGKISIDQLSLIHERISSLLAKEDAFIDAFYFCPHFLGGEMKEYAIDCACRKPKPGMLLQAAREFNIELEKSFMIGDKDTDIEAGQNAGSKSFLVRKGAKTSSCYPAFNNLEEAVNFILDELMPSNPRRR